MLDQGLTMLGQLLDQPWFSNDAEIYSEHLSLSHKSVSDMLIRDEQL